MTLIAITACGGVRDRIASRPSSAASAFDAAELVDVLPPDRIQSIDRPTFETPGMAAEWLNDDSPVIVLEVSGGARAYPLAIMVWHEIVNDTLGGRPIAVTYGPLYDSAVVFDRLIDGRSEVFGVSGKLHRSDLVMYDRRTKSLWPQSLGRAVLGPRRGVAAARLPAQVTSFSEFSRSHLAGTVLSRRTGFDRAYGFNPYEGYDSRDAPFPGFYAHRADPRLPAMRRVVGVAGRESRAYPYELLSQRGAVSDRVEGRDLAVLWRPGTRSALDSPALERGRDIGSAGVFWRVIDGRALDFEPVSEGFRDRQTGSVWTITGLATAGPLAGRRLDPVDHTTTFWFAWASTTPGTSVYEG